MFNIAIVEDSEIAWKIYDNIFADTENYTVHKAKKMSELANIDFSGIDIVLMDGSVDFPDDGYNAAKVLRISHPSLPIIISSFCPDPKLTSTCGANGYWTKDYFDQDSLIPLINTFIV